MMTSRTMRTTTPILPSQNLCGRTSLPTPSLPLGVSRSARNARRNLLWYAFQRLLPCLLSYIQLKTKYTVAANPPPGYLCHPCTKASGTDPFKKPAAPRKRKSAAEKRAITHFQERKFPSLVSSCIKVCICEPCPLIFVDGFPIGHFQTHK